MCNSRITVLTGMNAIDMCVLGLLVFPKSNMKAKLLNGWMNPEKNELRTSFPSLKPYGNFIILTLNCHSSHTRNIT